MYLRKQQMASRQVCSGNSEAERVKTVGADEVKEGTGR